MHAFSRPALAAAALAGLTSSLLTLGLTDGTAQASVSVGLPTDTSTSVTAVSAQSPYLAPSDASVAPLPAPVGFGAATTGGAGGAVVHVTTPSDSGSQVGSLRWALAQPGPKWIVFDGDMTITLGSPLQVPSNTTIDGRGDHVLITGHGTSGLLLNNVSNVVVESLELRDFGDTALTASNNSDDAMSITASTRVWIDHNTMSHAGDKLIGVQGGTSELTVSSNHFWDQEQTLQIGSMSGAASDVNQTVTITRNWFDHVGYRQPVVSYGKAHVFNNFIDSWTVYGVRSERLAQVYLEANVFLTPTAKKATTTDVGQDCNDYGTYCDDRPGYLLDTNNMYIGKVYAAASSSPDQVFDPHQAYAYTAAPATPDLAVQIADTAGSSPASGHVINLPIPVPPVVKPPKAPKSQSDDGSTDNADNSGTGSHGGRQVRSAEIRAVLHAAKRAQRLALKVSASSKAAGAKVVFLRQVGKTWVKVSQGKLDKRGTLQVSVAAVGGKAVYVAKVAGTRKTTSDASNTIKVA